MSRTEPLSEVLRGWSSARWVDWLAIWLLMVGIWPLADPGHSEVTFLSLLDGLVHGIGAMILISRWKIVRR